MGNFVKKGAPFKESQPKGMLVGNPKERVSIAMK
jgi:hypothetical protein